jgi:hypothetical protein
VPADESRRASSFALLGVFDGSGFVASGLTGESEAVDFRSPLLPRKFNPKIDFRPVLSLSGDSGGGSGSIDSIECFEDADDFRLKKGMPDGVRLAGGLLGDPVMEAIDGEGCGAVTDRWLLVLGAGECTVGCGFGDAGNGATRGESMTGDL